MTHSKAQHVKDKRTQREYGPGEWVIIHTPRPNCQGCLVNIQAAHYDAKVPGSSWGYFCPTHFLTLGCSLGLGRGQRLFLEDEVELIA